MKNNTDKNILAANLFGLDINNEQKNMELDNIINDLAEQSTEDNEVIEDFGDNLGGEYTTIQKAAMLKASKEFDVFYCDCFVCEEDEATIEIAYNDFETVVYYKADIDC